MRTANASATALALAVALVAAAPPLPARGDVASDARFFDRRARQLFDAGRYVEALRAFFLAQAASPSARLPYNIALCAELSGELWLAYAYYTEYLRGPDDDAARRAEAEAKRVALGRRLALVAAESDPAGADVFVDDARLGSYGQTPLVFPVDPGAHTLRLRREGYEEAGVAVVAERGVVREVDLALVPLPGQLRVDGAPAGGRVEVRRGAEVVAAGEPPLEVALPVGVYRVRYALDGHLPAERDAVVRVDVVERLTLAAVRTPEASAELVVSSGDVRAEVWVDGRRVGITPTVVPGLPPGARRVELRARGHRAFVMDVTLDPGEAFLLRARLEPR